MKAREGFCRLALNFSSFNVASLQAFLDYFYGLFSTNRAGLASLYQESSLLTFEGNKFQGQQAIIQKLTTMPFSNVAVQRDTIDIQPSISGGILIFVTGKLMVGYGRNAVQLSERSGRGVRALATT